MGKKVNPLIFRISNVKNPAFGWYSKWYAKKQFYAAYVKEDIAIRKTVKRLVGDVGIDKIVIQRSGKGDVEVILRVAKPGVIIGRGGEKSEKLRKEIKKIIDTSYALKLTIKELPKPNLSAEVLAEEAKKWIEKRMPFRKTMKKILDLGKKAGAHGVKISMAGRLNGVEIARHEKLALGEMPLQNLRANIDYARNSAHTKWGQIGIKIWVFKGEVFEHEGETDNR
jgi:small subunit ribosomal protein S3